MELLSYNNPNILELLNTPESAIIRKHPILDKLKSRYFLSKLCQNTFGKFALSQLKKSKGLNKKIINPVNKKRKSILDFCYVNYDNGSIPLKKYLSLNDWKQENCGLVNIPNMKDIYGLYYSNNINYKGIMKNINSNDINLSSIPKNEEQRVLMYFNRNGYSIYCKEYKEYWNWVKNRNEIRYESTISHGKKYDAKNMMHVFRLLDMAIEIAKENQINVKRNNRQFLLDIRSGKFEYDELYNMAQKKQQEMSNAYDESSLPEKPDLQIINHLTFEIRNELYNNE